MIFESKRSESDIIQRILTETEKGIKKTQLMYNANMSNTQLDRYLTVLLEDEFIEIQKSNKYYITDKGDQLLTHLNKVLNLINKS